MASFTGTFKMTKAKTPIKHPKIVNQWMVYEGLNDINSVFGALTTFEAYLKSPDFNTYHAQMALDCLRATLCTGTMAIENWCELEEVKP
jgi:hypothetical protein